MLLPAAWLGLNCAIWAAAAAGSVAAEIGPPVLDTNVVPEKVVGGNSAKYAASSAGLKLLSADTWPKVAFANPCELTLDPDVVFPSIGYIHILRTFDYLRNDPF